MNKTIFKRSRLALIAVLLLSCIFVFAACGGNSDTPGGNPAGGDSVTAISISKDAMPQTVYPEGVAFNTEIGGLKVEYASGKKETVALNAEGVQISGYDANKIGEQSVIITYGGKSISVSVAVEKRMTFNGYETSYFIGDTFNTSKGRVTIVLDDGSRISARLNEECISVVSFDSAAAGQGKPVAIRYSKNGVEYTDTIAVNVYGVGNVKFTKPNKTAYGSHETEIDLQGGYFTVTADGDESLMKRIPLEQSMISGFDTSVATKENVDTALNQTVSVTYAGQTYEFNITIHYSGVSIMNDAIETLKDVNLDLKDLQITTEQGVVALEAMMSYVDMTSTERAELNQDEVLKVAHVCAFFSRAYANEIATVVSGAVTIKDGNIGLVLNSTYAAVEEAVMFLSDPECALLKMYEFIESFVELFGEEILITDTENNKEYTIAQYVRYCTRDELAQVTNILEVMLQAYDYLEVVPEEWTVESLEKYGEPIESAVYNLSTFVSSKMITAVCNVISQWRTNDDYLDIIYSYYYHYLRGMMQEELSSIPFPQPVLELYSYVLSAGNIAQQVYQAGTSALWADVSEFYLYYHLAIQKAEEVKNHEKQLYRDLYAFINIDQLIDGYAKYAASGVVDMMKGAYDDPEIEDLMNTYMELMVIIRNNKGTLDFTENKDLIQSIFDKLVALTPAKQKAFLGSLYVLYGDEIVRDGMIMAYSQTNTTGSIFTYLLHEYFRYFLPESTHVIVQDLMLAMEYFMNHDMYDNAMTNFRMKMEAVNAAYNKLSAEDKVQLQQYVGNAYGKYNALYQLDQSGSNIDQELYANLFSELMQILRDFETLADNLANTETSEFNPGMMGAMMSAYARAQQIIDQLKALNDEQIMALYCLLEMEYDETSKVTLDVLSMRVQDAFLHNTHTMYITISYPDGSMDIMYAYDYYSQTKVNELGAAAFYVIMQQYNGSTQFEAEKVMAAMKAFRSTDIESIYVFYLLDFDVYYYAGLQTFLNEVLAGTNEAFANKLLEAEKACCEYFFGQSSEEKKAAFLTVMEELIAMRETVTDTEAFDTYLAEMYEYYLYYYNTLKEA